MAAQCPRVDANARRPPQTPSPLKGGALAITALALALGTFMQVLDSTIANVSLPTIAGNLGVIDRPGHLGHHRLRRRQRHWRAADRLADGPLRRGEHLRAVSVLAFTVASFLCGMAWSLPSLIVFRVLQGAVSGPMIPGSQALLISIFPPQQARAPRWASGR